MSSILLPPFEPVSPNNRGPGVSVTTFVLLSIAIIVVIARVASSFYLNRRVNGIDIPIWVATISALAQSTLTQLAVDHGLGKHRSTLSAATFEQYSKLVYASQLLLTVVLGMSKLSTGSLIHHLTPQEGVRKLNRIAIVAAACWTVFALFGLAFQCHFPRPWIYDPDRCSGRGAIQYPISIINIITDIPFTIIPVFILWNVQMAWSTRALVVCAFASRGLVAAVAATQLAFLPTYLHSSDPTWTIANPAICSEVMMNLSIIAACMPSLHAVVAGFGSGLNDLQIPEEMELSSSYRSRGTHLGTYRKRGQNGASNNSHSGVISSRAGRYIHSSKHRGLIYGTNVDSITTTITHGGAGSSSLGNPDQKRRAESALSTESTHRLTQEAEQESEGSNKGVIKTTEIWVDVKHERVETSVNALE